MTETFVQLYIFFILSLLLSLYF